MKEQIIKCDRCGRVIKEGEPIWFDVSVSVKGTAEMGYDGERVKEDTTLDIHDCCQTCFDSATKHICAWINRYQKKDDK